MSGKRVGGDRRIESRPLKEGEIERRQQDRERRGPCRRDNQHRRDTKRSTSQQQQGSDRLGE